MLTRVDKKRLNVRMRTERFHDWRNLHEVGARTGNANDFHQGGNLTIRDLKRGKTVNEMLPFDLPWRNRS